MSKCVGAYVQQRTKKSEFGRQNFRNRKEQYYKNATHRKYNNILTDPNRNLKKD